MSQHTFGGLVVGIGSILVGGAWLAGSLARLRRRDEMTTTFGASASGLYTYALTQVGCGGVLILIGLVIMAFVVVPR